MFKLFYYFLFYSFPKKDVYPDIYLLFYFIFISDRSKSTFFKIAGAKIRAVINGRPVIPKLTAICLDFCRNSSYAFIYNTSLLARSAYLSDFLDFLQLSYFILIIHIVLIITTTYNKAISA
jgi:hypothetical protein